MKKPNKPNKQYYLRSQGRAAIAIALGVLLLVNPDFGTATVGFTVGIVLMAFGALLLITSILSWPAVGVWEIALGAVALVAGGALLRDPKLLGKILGYVIAAACLLRGVQSLSESARMRKLGYDQKWNYILAGAMFLLAILLFIVPLTSSRILMRIVGGALVVMGILNLGAEAKYAKRVYLAQKDIIDADE